MSLLMQTIPSSLLILDPPHFLALQPTTRLILKLLAALPTLHLLKLFMDDLTEAPKPMFGNNRAPTLFIDFLLLILFIYRALGVLLYTIMYGENPFQDREEILRGEMTFPYTLESDTDPRGCRSLIRRLLCYDEAKRATLDEASICIFDNFLP
jgi:serine/threonine protein kinase